MVFSLDQYLDIGHLLSDGLGGFSKTKFRFVYSELLFRTNSLDDVPIMTKWFNDLDNMKWMDDPGTIYTLEGVTESVIDPDQWALDLSVEFDNKPIGYCSIYDIDILTRSAEISFVIGERLYQDKGFGKKMVLGLCIIGFNILKLNKLKAFVVKDNIPSMKVLSNSGFELKGERMNYNPATKVSDAESCVELEHDAFVLMSR
jgi:RimJ/RimL family protein N-acetyltransferase